MNEQTKFKRSSYKKINQDIRHQIIERILNRGQNIKQVSHEIGVNISTCKAIIKVYQQQGRVGKKNKRNKVYDVIQTFSFYCIKDGNIEQIGDIKMDESKISLERNLNFDKHLEDNAKEKAQKMFEQILVDKKVSDLAAAQLQRQTMQMYMSQNNYIQYYNPFIPNVLYQIRGEQSHQSPLTGSQNENPLQNRNNSRINE